MIVDSAQATLSPMCSQSFVKLIKIMYKLVRYQIYCVRIMTSGANSVPTRAVLARETVQDMEQEVDADIC